MPLTSKRRALLTVPLLLFFFLYSQAVAAFQVFDLKSNFPGLVAILFLVITTGILFSYLSRPVLGTMAALVTGLSVLGGGLFPDRFPLPLYTPASPLNIQEAATAFLLLSFIGMMGLYSAYMVYRHRSVIDVVLFGLVIFGMEIAYNNKVNGSYVIVFILASLFLLSTCKLEQLLVEKSAMPGHQGNIFSFRWGAWTALITLFLVIAGFIIPVSGEGLVYGMSFKAFVETLLGKEQKQELKKEPIKNRSEGAVSWVRLENFDLKGKVKLDRNVFMSVKSPEPLYWRGETSDYYTGRGWRNTLNLAEEKSHSTLLDPPWDRSVSTRQVEISVTMGAASQTTVVFSPIGPVEVRVPSSKYNSDEGGNIYTDVITGGQEFRVTSELPYIEEKKLRNSGTDYPRFIREHYLQLPEDLPTRVRHLAEKITAQAKNPYDKARAVEQYVKNKFPYTMEVEQTPRDKDVADFFLFELKKGYCTYHSTSMAVLLRAAGVPARWAKGFTPGRGSGGTYTVRNDDAHAWVEVYFDGYGWLPFEPTSSFSIPETAHKDVPAEVKAEEEKEQKTASAAGKAKVGEEEGTSIFVWVLTATVVVAAVAAGVVLWWRKRNDRKPGFATVQEAKGIYHALLSLLGLRGHPREQDQTPNEYASCIEKECPEFAVEVKHLTVGYLREKYSTNKLSEEEISELLMVWRTLYRKLVPENDIDNEK